jgi:4-carboxymuconolactone decarboxylase
MPTDESIAKGAEAFEKLLGWKVDPKGVDDEFTRVTMGNLFGDIWARPGLEMRDRSLITVAALITLAREDELGFHLRGALRMGITRDQIEEMILHLAHYVGWPIAVGAKGVAQKTFAEIDQQAEQEGK